MTEAQGSNEIKFRAAMLALRSLQQRELITHEEYVALKKKLSRLGNGSSPVRVSVSRTFFLYSQYKSSRF